MKSFVFIAFFLSTLSQISEAQRRGGGGRFAEMEKKAIAEPFIGVTADGKVEKGLFKIRSTGVKTTAVREAAQTFLAGLTADQRAKTKFPVDDDEWRRWANQQPPFTPSAPVQRRLQGPPAKSKFLAVIKPSPSPPLPGTGGEMSFTDDSPISPSNSIYKLQVNQP